MVKKITVLLMLFITTLTLSVQKVNAHQAQQVESELSTSVMSTVDNGELRAAWLTPIVGNIPTYAGESAFKIKMLEVLNVLEHYNYNAIIVHFRTHNNALYKSDLNRRADWFGNVNFNNFDPMAWLIEEAHNRGFEFHAWLNPYRLGGYSVGTLPQSNPESNAANILTNPNTGAKILNPGLPVVRQHIYNTVDEILENYNVDAIHFDDYFYINLGANGALTGANTILNEPDQQTFVQYGQGFDTNSASSKANWRRKQVDLLIEGVKTTINAFNQANGKFVQFGIAPTGIWSNGNGVVTYDQNGLPITTGSQTSGQNHYSSYLFSDSLNWVKNGWIDYIMPQTYWSINHPAGGYQKLLGWWDKVVKYLPINLYSGIGIYQANENPSTTNRYGWQTDLYELNNQFNLMRNTFQNVSGFSMYHYTFLENAYKNIASRATSQVKNSEARVADKAPLPELKSFTPILLPAVNGIEHTNGTLSFNRMEGTKFYYIYRSTGDLSYANSEIIGVVNQSSASKITYQTNDQTSNYNYGVRALSGTNTLGDISNVEVPAINLSGTKEGSEYTTEVSISFTSQNTVWYKLDNSEWTQYTTPITVKTNGTHKIVYKATSSEGDSLSKTLEFVVNRPNNDLPTFSIDGVLVNGKYEIGAKVTISSSEHQIYYKYNHGSQSITTWQLYTGPITLTDGTLASGNYLIYAKTVDPFGAESAEVTQMYTVFETVPADPVLVINGTGVAPYYKSAELSLNSTTTKNQYRVNGGAWQPFNEPVEFVIPGTYKVDYRASTVGNILTTTITIVEPVSTPTISIEGTLEGAYYKSAVTITLAAKENEKIFYRTHNGSSWTQFVEYTNPFEFKYTGTYYVEYYAKSLAGEESEKETKLLRLDVPFTEDNEYVIRNGENVFYYQTNTPVKLPTTYTEKTEEFRAVWVSTVSNIDIPQHRGETAYKAEIDKIIKNLRDNNFNAMFFQVRPMNDAFYESEFAPWSRYLGGAEGINPGWDVLGYIIEQAHLNGIEFHAWLNPYRVSSSSGDKQAQLNQLSSKNFAKLNPDYVIQDSKGHLILNPGQPEVRQYLYNVVGELLEKYDVDGIHFDDYFYSYSGTSNVEDQYQFDNYNPLNLSRDDWRRENVNELVKTIFENVEAHNEANNVFVKFGISPFGIWRNKSEDPELGSNSRGLSSYSAQYADTYKWIKEGWLHYVMPQLYWEFNHSTARFADLTDWWVNVVKDTNVDLIIGHGFYRYAETSSNWKDQNELLEQLRYISQYDEIVGSSFFSYKTLNSPHAFVTQAIERLNNYFWQERPDLPWETQVEAPKPVDPIDPVDPVDPVDPIDPVDPVDPENPKDNEITLDDVFMYTGIGLGALSVLVIGFTVIFKKRKV